MADATLLIDLGNTRLKWVRAVGGKLEVETAGRGSEADFEAAARAYAAPVGIRLSSVAGEEWTRRVVDLCGRLWQLPVEQLRSRAEQGGVRCAYADPTRLGVDRWLALVGAVAAYGKPVVVWDAGTATTLDAVDPSGQHLGGLILPGPETMRTSLAEKTRLNVPASLAGMRRLRPGRDTGECIVHGILAAQVGAAEWFLREVSSEGSGPATLVVTGGAADLVREAFSSDSIHDPWLVFRGMLVGR